MARMNREYIGKAFAGKLSPCKVGEHSTWISGDFHVSASFSEDDTAGTFSVVGYPNGKARDYDNQRYTAEVSDTDTLLILLGITAKTPESPKLSQAQLELLWAIQAARHGEILMGVPRELGGVFIDGQYISSAKYAGSFQYCTIKGLNRNSPRALRDKTGLIEYHHGKGVWRLTEKGDTLTETPPATISHGLIDGAVTELGYRLERVKNGVEQGDPVVIAARLEALKAAQAVLQDPAANEALRAIIFK